jgi:hypothetical protein
LVKISSYFNDKKKEKRRKNVLLRVIETNMKGGITIESRKNKSYANIISYRVKLIIRKIVELPLVHQSSDQDECLVLSLRIIKEEKEI